jgi:hypothetical protein
VRPLDLLHAEESPTAPAWLGWVLLVVLTAAILALAIFRPTDPSAIINEIRLAAGFDRYQAAMNEGDRLLSRATADFRMAVRTDDDRSVEYAMLAEAEQRFLIARREAEGFGEDQRAQIRLLDVYYTWARALYLDGTGEWYRRNDRTILERARDLAERGLALPNITGNRRERMAGLKTRIDRAITPWPIL